MSMENRTTGTYRANRVGLARSIYAAAALVISVFLTTVPVRANESSFISHPPQGLVISGPVELYNPGNLYEKINGQAELYLTAGFLELKSRWFEHAEDAGKMIEMNVYSMGSLLNAFSVFSQQQRYDAKQLNITQFAYQTQSAVFLVHGAYYVEILPSEFSNAMTDLAKQLAEQFVKTTHVENAYLEEIEYFPPENLDRGSITVISKNAFGMNGLDKVFMATYTLDGGQLTAYISDQNMPEAAKSTVLEVHGHFMRFGGVDIKPDVNIEGARMLTVMDNYELIFSIGPYLVGIHEAGTRLQAENMGALMHKFLQERRK